VSREVRPSTRVRPLRPRRSSRPAAAAGARVLLLKSLHQARRRTRAPSARGFQDPLSSCGSERTDLTAGRGQLADEGSDSEPPVVVTEPGTHGGERRGAAVRCWLAWPRGTRLRAAAAAAAAPPARDV
jgi:hypothetical protein